MILFNNEADDSDNAIANTNSFKSFKYKTKLIGCAAAANEILEHETIAVPLTLKRLGEWSI